MPTFTEALLSSFGQAVEMDRQKRLDKQAAEQRKIENQRAEQAQKIQMQNALLEAPLKAAKTKQHLAEADYYTNRLPAQQALEATKAAEREKTEEDKQARAAAGTVIQGYKTGMSLPSTLAALKLQYPNISPEALQSITTAHVQGIQGAHQAAIEQYNTDLKDWQERTGLTPERWQQEGMLRGIEPPPHHPGPVPTAEQATTMTFETPADRRLRYQQERDARKQNWQIVRDRQMIALRQQHEMNAVKEWNQKFQLQQNIQTWRKTEAAVKDQIARTNAQAHMMQARAGQERIGLEKQRIGIEQRREDRLTRHERYAPLVAEYGKAEAAARNGAYRVRQTIANIDANTEREREMLRSYKLNPDAPITQEMIDKASSDPSTLANLHAAVGKVQAAEKMKATLGQQDRALTEQVLAAQRAVRDMGYGPTTKGGKPIGPLKEGGSNPDAKKYRDPSKMSVEDIFSELGGMFKGK